MLFFFFNDTATTEIYTLSLHDALPISWHSSGGTAPRGHAPREDRIHYRSVGPEICSCSKGSICPVDERDRNDCRPGVDHRGEPHPGGRGRGIRKTIKSALASHRDSVFERHDRDRGDAQVL